MHWGSAHLGGTGGSGINAVTLPAFDPISRQPELKHCAVRIAKAELPWRVLFFAYPHASDVLELAGRARAWLPRFAFATCVLVGRERQGVLFRAAAPAPIDARVLEPLDSIFGLKDHLTLTYDDVRRGISRRIRVHEGRIEAVRLAGDLAAEPWLRELFERQDAVTNLGGSLLAPTLSSARRAATGHIVCSCWSVSKREICEFAVRAKGDGGDVMGALQAALKCGTQCGSCVPELKRLVTTAKAAA
jgi:assimilatory nitrate reductase catalytic subunit